MSDMPYMVSFANLLSFFIFFLPMKMTETKLRPSYFIFIGYLKTVCVGGGDGGRSLEAAVV